MGDPNGGSEGGSVITLLDTPEELAVCEVEIGCMVGQLLTPLTRYRNRAKLEGRPWAIDNGAFSRFDAKKYSAMLEREAGDKEGCVFVTAPDIVGSARRTLEVFRHWYPTLHGWPVALVAQDGQEDLDIPWHLLAAVFIGGSTEWKLSDCAAGVVKAAKAMGKWAHIGRVNTPVRVDRFDEMGADSFDGTGVARYTHMRLDLKEGLPLFRSDAEKEQVSQ